VRDPYGDKPPPEFTPRTPADYAAEIAEIATYKCQALPSRKLREESLRYFGIRIGVSESDGVTPACTYFPYGVSGQLNGWKAATLGEHKRQWSVGNTRGVDFFGWGRAIRSGQRTLYITEGEYDAVALYQILKDANARTDYADQEHAVVSLIHGASSAKKDILRHMSAIMQHFDNVVLVFDMDEKGQKAADAVCRLAPTFMTASLPCKDANACLMEGASKACKAAVVWKAAKPKNTRLVMGSTLREVARQKAEMGMSWPWQGMTDVTRGVRLGETIYIGAGVKMGKSELVNAIGEHLITEHGKSVMFCKPEEQLGKSYKMLVGKAAGRIFHDPTIEFDEAAFDKGEALIGDKAIFSDVYQFVDWEQLKADIIYARHELGVDQFMIDPITCFTNQMESGDANQHLTALTADIAAMAKDNEFTAWLYCHLKAPSQGDPHERGGKVLSNQFAGSRAMMRACNYMIGLEGNKDPELSVEERNMRNLVLLEDREFGQAASIQLYWNNKTGMFTEVKR